MNKFHSHILLPIVALLFSISGNAQVDITKELFSESGDGSWYFCTAYGNLY